MPQKREEFFDVVDENNKVIGREKRSIVHKKGLWHRAVYVFLFSRRNEIFIQKRAASKDVCPGLWDLSVAEHLKCGESYEKAAERGMKEELNIRAADLKKIGELRFMLKDKEITEREFNSVYMAGFAGKIKLDKNEVQKGRWIKKQNLLDEMKKHPERFTPWIKQAVKFL